MPLLTPSPRCEPGWIIVKGIFNELHLSKSSIKASIDFSKISSVGDARLIKYEV